MTLKSDSVVVHTFELSPEQRSVILKHTEDVRAFNNKYYKEENYTPLNHLYENINSLTGVRCAQQFLGSGHIEVTVDYNGTKLNAELLKAIKAVITNFAHYGSSIIHSLYCNDVDPN